MKRTHKYADGGKIVTTKKKKRGRANPSMLGSGTASQAGNTLRNRRSEQMRSLGLRDGGMPKPKKGPKPRRITTTNPPGGPRTPGARGGNTRKR